MTSSLSLSPSLVGLCLSLMSCPLAATPLHIVHSHEAHINKPSALIVFERRRRQSTNNFSDSFTQSYLSVLLAHGRGKMYGSQLANHNLLSLQQVFYKSWTGTTILSLSLSFYKFIHGEYCFLYVDTDSPSVHDH